MLCINQSWFAGALDGSRTSKPAELKPVLGGEALPFTWPAITELMTGQIHVLFSTMPPALPHVKSGKLRALGVSSRTRAKTAPDLPTLIEAGVPGFDVLNWQGLVVPIKTSAAIVAKLNRDVQAALARPGMNELLAAQGLDAAGGTPEAFGKLIAAEIARYKKLVQAAKIQAE